MPKKKTIPILNNVTSSEELQTYWNDEKQQFRNDLGEIDYDSLLDALHVEGDTQVIGSQDHKEYTHPVLKLLHERRKNNSTLNSQHVRDEDGCRIALAVEGGGMRGCISAGMICAIHHLNLTESFDVIHGSSAGSIVAAYFITGQVPTGQVPGVGPEVYYDSLTTAGKGFIHTRRIIRSMGLGLLDPRLLKDVLTRPHGKPVLNLDYLLKTTVRKNKRLNWDKFQQMQKVLPLKIVASGLASEAPVVMEMKKGHFQTLEELTDAMHSSCLLPGVAGPLMNLNKNALNNDDDDTNSKKFYLGDNDSEVRVDSVEPLADALLYEPLPYRSALKEGATHVVVIRSRPDGVDVTGKSSFIEKRIMKRFFLKKNHLPNIFKLMRSHMHKKLYAEEILTLNEYAKDEVADHRDTSKPHLLTIALPPDAKEVTKLETDREAIFHGMRTGFARGYDALVDDPMKRGRGMEVAKEVFPDEILDYDPLEIESKGECAFEAYMREYNIKPKVWNK